jgi:beta-phosphoglucomutase-like phosphatase (HAD superfamily)
MTILDFSVSIFDLDGVVINSEFIHYECYKSSFKKQINYDLEWDEYCEIHHSLANTFEKQFPESYKEICYNKTQLYKNTDQ